MSGGIDPDISHSSLNPANWNKQPQKDQKQVQEEEQRPGAGIVNEMPMLGIPQFGPNKLDYSLSPFGDYSNMNSAEALKNSLIKGLSINTDFAFNNENPLQQSAIKPGR